MLRESGTHHAQPRRAEPPQQQTGPSYCLAHRRLDQIQYGTESLGIVSGRQSGHQSVEDEIQIGVQHLARHVVTQPARLLLLAEPLGGRGGQFG